MNLNKIKEGLFYQKIHIGKINISYKNGSLLAGLMAYILLFNGAILILINPLVSIFQILYAFLILLPLSYYQNKMSESMDESIGDSNAI